jgi:hypothetical protein
MLPIAADHLAVTGAAEPVIVHVGMRARECVLRGNHFGAISMLVERLAHLLAFEDFPYRCHAPCWTGGAHVFSAFIWG